MKFDLVKHLATQDPWEVNRVFSKFCRWPSVGEEYTVGHEVFEHIRVGFCVPEPPMDAVATKTNHFCPVVGPRWRSLECLRTKLEREVFVDEPPLFYVG